MTTIMIEPADEHRQGFARWCLAQNPPIHTASAFGSEVPAELFPAVPDELLDGAYIDGHVFRPVKEGLAPAGAGYAPEQHQQAAEEPQQASRPRRTRKAVAK